MAEGVYKHEIAIAVLSPLGLWYLVMHMQLFIIEERVLADWAYPMMLLGDFLSTGWEIFDFQGISPLPVGFESGVIW